MKRFLALLMALVMIFCLAACGEDKKDDGKKQDEAASNDSNKGSNNGSGITNPLAGSAIGMSIADLDALANLFLDSGSATNIKDLYIELGASNETTVLSLGAKVAGKAMDADLFMGEDIVISAPGLLDKNYGISLENLDAISSMLESIGGSMDSVSGILGSSGSMDSVSGILGSLDLSQIDPEVITGIVSNFYGAFIDALCASDSVSSTVKGGKTVISGTLHPEDVADIMVSLIEKLYTDETLLNAIAGPMGVDVNELKQMLIQSIPKEEIKQETINALSESDIVIQINSLTLDGSKLPVAGDFELSGNVYEYGYSSTATLQFAFDLEQMTCSASLKENNTELMRMNVANGEFTFFATMDGQTMEAYAKITDTSFEAWAKQNGQKIMDISMKITANGFNMSMTSNGQTYSASLVVSSNSFTFTMNMNGSTVVISGKTTDNSAEGTVTMDGQQLGKVTFGKKVSGTKTTYTLKTITVQGQSLDFSAAGISFYFDSDADAPKVPAYTDITTMSTADMESLMMELMSNPQLMEIFSQFMPNYGGDFDYDFDYDDYYGDYDYDFDY